MKRAAWFTLILVPVLALAGACRRTDAPETESPPAPATGTETGAARESEEAGVDVETERFTPPADGKLTAEQVEMYIAVRRERAAAGTTSALAEGGPVGLATLASMGDAFADTAESLGYDRDEYAWVAARVVEARPLPFGNALAGVARAFAQASLAGLEKRLGETDDAEERARLEQEIARLKASQAGEARPAGRPKTEAQKYNEELVARYEEELKSVDAALAAEPPSQDSLP